MMSKLSSDMRKAQFKPATVEEAIINEIKVGIHDQQSNSKYANYLLLQIARAVGVSTNPSSLKLELDSLKKEKEDARSRENQEEYRYLEQIIAILSCADAATSASEKGLNYQKKRGLGGWGGHPLPPLQSFYCPITHEIMEEPVDIASGQTYERYAIEKWFSAGNSNCPITKVELENLQIKLNLALKKSIQEWKERNIAISIAATKPKLQSTSESEICSALRMLLDLSEEKGIHRYWIALEGLIPCLVQLLSSSQRTVRKETLEVLRSLSIDNKENKEHIAAAGAIKLVVKSLARDLGEGRQAVALLRELSKDPEICEKIGKVQGCILLLVTMLNAENPHAVTDAKELLNDLANNDQNVVQMGEANYFGPLTQRLNEGPDMAKILMANALSRMGLTDQSKAALAAQGAIPPLVSMISIGKLEAKTAALGALKNLSTLPDNRDTMIEAGVIPPLLQLLFSVTSGMTSLKENAAATLANLAMASTTAEDKIDHHYNILESDKTMVHLLSLLNIEGAVIRGHLLRALLGMSSIPNAREVRTKMRKVGAIQLLLPFCEDTVEDVRIHALKLLKCLSSEGAGKDIADHLGPSYIRALVKLLGDSSGDEEKLAAVGIISNLPTTSAQMTDILLQADALAAIVNLLIPSRGLKSSPRAVRNALSESATGALLRFTSPENPNVTAHRQKAADLDAIPRLVTILQTGTPLAKCRAAIALGHFSLSSDSLASIDNVPQSCLLWCRPATPAGCCIHGGPCTVKSTFCLVMAQAVLPLVQALEEQEDGADDAALTALRTLLLNDATLENGVKVIAQAQGIRPIVRLLTVGSVDVKEKAVWMLEKIFRIEEYKVEFGSAAQMPLIDLTQNGSIVTRPLAAKILAHLNILHSQSTYF
nr:U-box domain-containing protein 43-like isoform X2 [Physcomitrium patens]|eukprot:XP_024393019.1 U-box domain-containing protein 43-like isoform X2 [Physcomitrella patens]